MYVYGKILSGQWRGRSVEITSTKSGLLVGSVKNSTKQTVFLGAKNWPYMDPHPLYSSVLECSRAIKLANIDLLLSLIFVISNLLLLNNVLPLFENIAHISEKIGRKKLSWLRSSAEEKRYNWNLNVQMSQIRLKLVSSFLVPYPHLRGARNLYRW